MIRQSLLIVLCLPGIAFAEYRVPSADIREASPAQVSGEILDISGNIVIVHKRGEEISVLTGFDTHIFTTYGGILRLQELCKGSNIQVWYRTPDANVRISTAVSIKVPESC